MNPICWLLLGAIAGALAVKITPNSQRKDIWGNILFGIMGALFGGFFALFYASGHLTLTLAHLSIFGISLAVMGAIVAIFVWQAITRTAV